MTPELEKLIQILRDNAVSAAAARRAIFTTLLESDRPLKNGEIASRTPSVNRASAYRTLVLFEQLGITSTLVRGWTPFIELADLFKPHHHHLVCEQCHASIEITSQKIERLVHHLAEEQRFRPTSHHFEINGTCKTCREAMTN